MKATPRAGLPLAALLLALLSAGFGLAGCSGTSNDSASGGSSASEADSGAGSGAGARADARADAGSDSSGGLAVADAAGVPAARQADGVAAHDPLQQAAVISTGDVQLRDKDVAEALFHVRQVVDRYQGSVEKESTDTDQKGRPVRSRLVVRVPSAGFADAMKALGSTATLVSTSSNSKDVTTAVLDNNVRVDVEKRSIARISTLLDQATSIKDVIAIESQLSQRQADLASLEQQQRYLADQTSMSTITVSVERTSPSTHTEPMKDHTGFAAGLGAGWHALRGFVVGLLTVLGAVLPWLAVALVLAIPGVPLWRRLSRSRRAPAVSAEPSTSA